MSPLGPISEPVGGPAHVFKVGDAISAPFVDFSNPPGRDPAALHAARLAAHRRELHAIEHQIIELEAARCEIARRVQALAEGGRE